MRVAPTVALSPEERARLVRWAEERSEDPRSLRARIVLAAADGAQNQAIAETLDVSRLTVARWRDRFLRHRLPGLADQLRAPSTTPGLPDDSVRAIVRATRAPPPPGVRAWSTRSLGRRFGVSHMTVQRIWTAHRLRPVRFDAEPLRPDPISPARPRDVVGLYLNRPDGAIAFVVGGGLTERGASVLGELSSERSVPVVSVFPPERAGPPFSARGDRVTPFLRFLRGAEDGGGPAARLRVLTTGPAATGSARVESWSVRHPSAHVVPFPQWSSWQSHALAQLRRIDVPGRSRDSRHPRVEAVRSIARFLRDYSDASGPFVWTAPPKRSGTASGAARLRYELAVTGHPGFKNPPAGPDPMRAAKPPTAESREMARNVLRRCLRVKPGEQVTISSWTSTLPEANAFVLESLALGARPFLQYQDEATYWAAAADTPVEHLGRLGRHLKAAIERTDVLVSFFGPSDRERFHALPPDVLARLCDLDDDIYAAAARAGARAVQMALGRASAASARMYGVNLARWRTELVRGSLVAPAELHRRGAPIAAALSKGRELRISHPNGTDLTLRLKRRPARLADGAVGPARRGGGWSLVTVPAGVVTVAVDERYAEGTFRSNVPSSVGLSRGVGEFAGGRWTFSRGRLARYAYDDGGDLFAESYAGAGPGRDLPGSVSIGLNDAISTAPLLEDQGTGTVTFHIGRNDYLGGSNDADWWAWLYLRGADVRVDGRPLVTRGRLPA